MSNLAPTLTERYRDLTEAEAKTASALGAVVQLRHSDYIRAYAWAPKCDLLAMIDSWRSVLIVRVSDYAILKTIQSSAFLYECIAWSRDGRRLFVATRNEVIAFDPLTGKFLPEWSVRQNEVKKIRCSPDGRFVASWGTGNSALVWDSETGAIKYALDGHDAPVTTLAWSPDGAVAATGSKNGKILLWNMRNGACTHRLEGHKPQKPADPRMELLFHTLGGDSVQLNSLAFSKDGRWLASGGDDTNILIWNTTTGEMIREIEGDLFKGDDLVPKSLRIISLAWIGDGQYLEVCRADNTTSYLSLEDLTYSFWKVAWAAQWLEDGKTFQFVDAHGNVQVVSDALDNEKRDVRAIHAKPCRSKIRLMHRFASDNRFAFEAGSNLILWSPKDNSLSEQPLPALAKMVSVAPDGRFLAGASGGWILIWDLIAKVEIRCIQHDGANYDEYRTRIACGIDGRWVATADSNGKVFVWEKKAPVHWTKRMFHDENKPTHVLNGGKTRVMALAVSSNGDKLASGDDQRTLLWNTTTWVQNAEIKGSCRTISFSPDGRYIACGGENSFCIWDLTMNLPVVKLDALPYEVCKLTAWSTNNQFLAVVGWNDCVQIWDINKSSELTIFHPGAGDITAISFTGSDQHLALGYEDGTLRVWSWPDQQSVVDRHLLARDSWIHLLPDGRFDCSDGAIQHLRYTERESLRSCAATAVVARFHQPDEVALVVAKAFEPTLKQST